MAVALDAISTCKSPSCGPEVSTTPGFVSAPSSAIVYVCDSPLSELEAGESAPLRVMISVENENNNAA